MEQNSDQEMILTKVNMKRVNREISPWKIRIWSISSLPFWEFSICQALQPRQGDNLKTRTFGKGSLRCLINTEGCWPNISCLMFLLGGSIERFYGPKWHQFDGIPSSKLRQKGKRFFVALWSNKYGLWKLVHMEICGEWMFVARGSTALR